MIKLDGHSLTIEQLVEIARDPSVAVERDPATDKAVARSEALIPCSHATHSTGCTPRSTTAACTSSARQPSTTQACTGWVVRSIAIISVGVATKAMKRMMFVARNSVPSPSENQLSPRIRVKQNSA